MSRLAVLGQHLQLAQQQFLQLVLLLLFALCEELVWLLCRLLLLRQRIFWRAHLPCQLLMLLLLQQRILWRAHRRHLPCQCLCQCLERSMARFTLAMVFSCKRRS
uniref:Putative secreted protein n=1 Tax=Ixodes ricinus TaxID=34613 RepID=A0A147BUW7_IXORI